MPQNGANLLREGEVGASKFLKDDDDKTYPSGHSDPRCLDGFGCQK